VLLFGLLLVLMGEPCRPFVKTKMPGLSDDNGKGYKPVVSKGAQTPILKCGGGEGRGKKSVRKAWP